MPDAWTTFCAFVIILMCVILVIFCTEPPAPRNCHHDMNMKTLRCRTCGVVAPFGYDGYNMNLERHPYPNEGNSEEDFLENDPYEIDSD